MKCSKDTEEGVISSSRLGKGQVQERPARRIDSYVWVESMSKNLGDERDGRMHMVKTQRCGLTI